MASQTPAKVNTTLGEIDNFATGDFVPVTSGGTGQTVYTEGDLLAGAAGGGLTKIALGANGTVLSSNGTDPVWAAVADPSQSSYVNDEASALLVGNWMYADATGGAKKAKADASTTVQVVGISLTAAAAAGSAVVQGSGIVALTTGQWDAIAGTTGGLAVNTPYFLSAATAGAMSATPPATAGQKIVRLGIGLGPTKMRIAIQAPIGL
jgi:hypothetical protein